MATVTEQLTGPAVDESRVDSPTEGRNPRSVEIDCLSTLDVLRLLNAEDATVAGAVAAALHDLAAAVDLVVAALAGGGRVHYLGAGTSGRLAAQDADELGPTYGLEPGRVVARVAAYEGGAGSTRPSTTADGEDDAVSGAALGAAAGPDDVVIGITASARTPYVVAALSAARRAGAATVLIGSNPRAPLGAEVDVHVCLDTGPEAVTGSTRLKAGTAQKMALNALSTAAMVRLGRTWSNLMIGAVATNAKLRGRLVHALVAATGEDPQDCAAALDAARGDGRAALVALLGAVSVATARAALAEAGGSPRAALATLASRRG
jgi:N-acetylmuramic acid 6-phosphate etherase